MVRLHFNKSDLKQEVYQNSGNVYIIYTSCILNGMKMKFMENAKKLDNLK